MRRSAQLVSLTREHHSALVLARRTIAAARSVCDVRELAAALPDLYRRALEPHFLIEERLLLAPLAETGAISQVARTVDEHRRLRKLALAEQPIDDAGLASFGRLLEAHVRFEERELFPLAEALLPAQTLAAVAAGAAANSTSHFSTV